MESENSRKTGAISSRFSRRNLLRGAAALSGASAASNAVGQQATAAPFGTVWAYVGTYTGSPGAFASNGMGIYLGALNLFTGRFSIPETGRPGFARFRKHAGHVEPVDARDRCDRQAPVCRK